MSLTLSPAMEEKAVRIARTLGVTPDEWIESLIERQPDPIPKTDTPLTPGMRFRDIVAPLQQDFEASGMTEEELDDFIEAEVKAHRAEQSMTSACSIPSSALFRPKPFCPFSANDNGIPDAMGE